MLSFLLEMIVLNEVMTGSGTYSVAAAVVCVRSADRRLPSLDLEKSRGGYTFPRSN